MAPASPGSPPDKGIAFSSFAHIHDLQALEFAVVLREEGNGEDIVSRMLPMSRIVPGEVKVKEKRVPKQTPISTKEPCTRPECMQNKCRTDEMLDTNEGLREQLEDLDGAIGSSVNKLSAIDKQNKAADDQNEELQGAMQEIEQQAATLEIEAEEGSRQKRDLLNKVAQLEAEVVKFNKQAEDRRMQMENAMKATKSEVVFGRSPQKNSLDSLFVSSLDLWDINDTIAQENFLANTNRPKTTPGRVFRAPVPEYMKRAQQQQTPGSPAGGRSPGRSPKKSPGKSSATGMRTRSRTIKTSTGGVVKAF
ncbi:hypothetical protein ScalyP_jg969 [Parmales sp. scaly parma]|nr:hypothetical protein ScalyP_jg969 [Parmales sp. scaly parma]|tara:strand:+ start:33 stop:953 length:921 start_codon:yes stop_codon:yes gene_type:complete